MERKKPGSGAGCYTMLYALRGEQQLLERPVGTKLPLIPGSKPQFCRTALSEKLHQPSPDFTLTDPHGFLLDSKYNSLHDPHLRTYYHRKGMQESLQNRGLINEQKKVLCSLKEYNQYHNYLSNVKLQYDKNYATKQKTIVKKFLELQEQNKIPRDISFTDVREWLLEEGSKNISDQIMANRDRHQAGAPKTEEICSGEIQRMKDLQYTGQDEMWKIRERAFQMRIEEDARREVRQAQQKKEIRARRHKKAFELYERKVALQQQKLNESLQERKDFEREMQDSIKRQYFNEILQSGKQASTEIISKENRDVTIANEKSSKITKVHISPDSTEEVTTDSKWFHEVSLISQLSDGERKVIENSLYGQITTEELNGMAENIVVWVAASIIRVLLPAISLYNEERSRSVSHCSFESPVYFSSSEETLQATLSSHSLLGTESGSTWQSQSRSSSFMSTRCRISTPFPSPLSSSGSSGEETEKNTPCRLKSRTPSKEIVVADGGEDAGKPLSEPLKDLFGITKSSIITKAERIVQDVLSRAFIEAQLPAQLMEPQCCALGVLITHYRSNNLATELVDGVIGRVKSALSENKQRIPTPKTVHVNLEAQTKSVASEVASEIIQVVSGRLQPFFTSAVESGSTCRLLGGHGGDLHALGQSQRLHSEEYDEAELAVTATEIISTVLQEVKSEFCKANTENEMSDVKETYSGDNQSMSDFVSAILKNLETISPSSSLSVEKNYLLQSPDAQQNERDEAKVTKKRTNGSRPPSVKLKSHASESSVGMKRANSDIAFGISKAKIIEIADQIVSQIIEKTKQDFTPVGNNLHESNSKESLLLPEAAEISILEKISPKSQIPNNRVTVIAKDIVNSVFENVSFALNCIETNKYLQESNKNVAAALQTSRGSTETGSIDDTFDISSVAKGIVRTIFGKLKSLLTQTEEDVSSSSSPAQSNAKSSSVSSSPKNSVFSDSVSDISDLCTYTVETAGAICEAMKKELDQEIYCTTMAKKASDESLLAREVVTSVLEYLEEQYILDTIKSPSPYPKDWERDASTFIREESNPDQSKSQISPVEEIILSDIDKATGQVPNQITMEICRYPPKVVSSENISSKQQIGQMDMNLVEDNLSVSSSGESIISDAESEGSEKMPRTSSSVFHSTATRIISEIIEKAAAKCISSGLAHLPEQPNSTADDVCKTPDATKHAQEAMSSASSSHVQTTELASDIVVDVLEKLHYATCFEKISFSTDYKDKFESCDTALLPGTSEIKTDTRTAEHLRTMTEELFKTVKNKLKHFWNQKSLSLFKARKVLSAKEQRSADSLEMFPPSVQVSHLSFSEPHLTKKSMSVPNSAPRKHLSEDSEPLGVLMNVDFSRQSRTNQENQANLIICAKDVGSQILQTIRREINRGDDKGCCSGARAKPSEETLQASELVDSVLSTFENLKVSDVVLKPDYETMHLSGEQYGKDRMSSAEDTVHKEYTKSNRREYSAQRFPPVNVPGMVIDSYTDDTEVMSRDSPYRALTDASSKLQHQPTPTAEQENELTCKSNRVPRSRVWKKPSTSNDMGLGEQEFMELPCRSNVIEDSFTDQNSLNAAEQKRGSEKTTLDNVEEGDQPSPLISPKLDFSAEHIARAEPAVSDIEIVAMSIVDIIMGELGVTEASDTKSKSRASQKKSECAAGLVTENIAFQTHSNNVNLNIEKLSAEEASCASQVPGATAKHNLPPLQTRVSEEPKDQVRTSTESSTMSPIERKVEQLVSSGSLRVFSEELVKNVFHLILKSGIAVQLGTAHKSNSDPTLKSRLVVQNLSHPKSSELSMQLLYSFTEKSVKKLLKQCLSFPDSPTSDENEKDVSLFQDCDTNPEFKSSQRISEKVSLTAKDHRPQKSTEPSVPSSQMYHDAINQLSSLLVKSVMDVLSAVCDLSMEPEDSENQGNIPAARVTSEIEKSSSEELKRDSHLENSSEIKPLSVPVEPLNIEPVSSVGLQEISMAKSTESLNMTLVCTETVENIITQLLLQIYPTLIKEETSTEIPGKMSVSLLSQLAVDLFDSVLQDLSENQEITVVKQGNDVFHEPHKIQQVASSVHNELLCQTGSQQVLQKAVASRNETVVKTIISSMVTNISKLTHSASRCSSLSPETSISREASEIVDEVMGDIRITSEHNKEATPSAQSSEVSLVSSEIVHGVTDNLLKEIQLNCSSPESSTPQAAIDMETRSTEQLMCTKTDQLEPSPVIGRTVRSKKLQSSMTKSPKGFSPTVRSGFENSFQPEDTMDKPCSSRSLGEAVGVTPCSNKKKDCLASETPEKPGDYLVQRVQDLEGVQQCKASGKTVKKTKKSSSRPDCIKTQPLETSSHDVKVDELMSDIRITSEYNKEATPSAQSSEVSLVSSEIVHGVTDNLLTEIQLNCSSPESSTPQAAIDMETWSTEQLMCTKTDQLEPSPVIGRIDVVKDIIAKLLLKIRPGFPKPEDYSGELEELSESQVRDLALKLTKDALKELSKVSTLTISEPKAEGHIPSQQAIKKTVSSVYSKLMESNGNKKVLQVGIASENPEMIKEMACRVAKETIAIQGLRSGRSIPSSQTLISQKTSESTQDKIVDTNVTTVRSKKLQSSMTKSPKGFSPIVSSGFENSFQPEDTMDKPCSSSSLGEAVGVTPCSNKKKDCLASETPEKPGDYLVQRVQDVEGVQQCKASGKTVKKTKKSSSRPHCMKTQPLESFLHDVKVDELMSDIRITSEHNKEATPSAQSSAISLVSSEIVHGVTDNLLKKIQLNCSSPESSTEDLKRPLQTLSEMVISITESVIMQLSAVPGIIIGTAEHDRCIFLQPSDADQMIEKVYNDLLQESGSLIALYKAVMSKNQEVSNAIIVSLVKELSKLYFSTAESSASGPSPSSITNEATNDVNSSENDTLNLGCQKKGMSASEPPSDIHPPSDIPPPYSDIVKKIVTKLLLRIHPISPKREEKQEQIMESLSCWELSEFAVGIIDNVLTKLFTAPDTSECNPTMGSNIQCELVSVKQVASCIYRELLQSAGSKDNLQQAVAAKSEALAKKIVNSLVRKIMKFQHSDIKSSDAPQAAIGMETQSTEQLMCTKTNQLEPSPVMCRTDAVKDIMAKLLLKIRPGFPNPENYSGEVEELSESQVRDLALKLTKDALKELSKVSTLTISEPKAEEHLPLQQAIKKTVSSVYSKLMESIGSKKVLQVGIASQNPEMIKEMACCVAKETIAIHGLRSGCSIPSSQSLISQKTSESTQDKIVDTNVTTVRSKKLQSSMKKSPKGFSPTVQSVFENSFQPEDTMDKPCSSRSLGEAVGVTPCSNKKKGCSASETPEKPGDYLAQRVQDQEVVQQCKASGNKVKKTRKSSSRPDSMKTRLLESSSHDVVDEELPGHSSWYVYNPSLNKDKNLSPAQSKSGLHIDIAKHYMTPMQLTKTSESEGLLSHSNIPFAVNTPDEDVNVSQKVKKHPLKKFGSMIKHKIMGNRSKDFRIQNETNPSLENLRAQGTSSGRGSCESFGPFKVPDEYNKPQKHKFFKKEVFSLDRFSRNKPQNTPDGIPVIPNSRKMPKKPSLLSKMSTALSRAFL